MLRGKGLLTPIQRAFMEAFARLPDQERFYLAGGTALAEFYLGHRLSFDLDFFTPEAALILPLSYQIETLGEQAKLSVSVIVVSARARREKKLSSISGKQSKVTSQHWRRIIIRGVDQ